MIKKIAYEYYNKSLTLAKNGNITLAKKELSSGLKLYNNDVEMLNLMGMLEYLLCNFEDAYIYWINSLKLNTKNNKANEYIKIIKSEEFYMLKNYYDDALINIENENYDKSIKLLEYIININEDLIEPYKLIIKCYEKKQNNNNLKKYLNEFIPSKNENEINKYLEKLLLKDKENIKYIKRQHRLKYKIYKCKLRRTQFTFGLSIFALSILYITMKG